MRTISRLGMVAALVLGGCAGETGSEEQTGDVEDAATHFDNYNQYDDRRIGPTAGFMVAENGRVAVNMEPKWKPKNPSYHCKVQAIQISLTKRAPKFDAIGVKSIATFGGPSNPTWSGLRAGLYSLELNTANDNPACALTGAITITVTP